MKRTVIAVSVTALAVAGGGVAAAKPGQSNGAQKAGLAAVTGNSLAGCAAAKGAGKQTATGFVVLNAPGKPGAAHKIVGEVAVKDATPGTYEVRLALESGCGEKVGTLTVGPNRQGNAHISSAYKGESAYYVTLTRQPLGAVPVVGELYTSQSYASAPVLLR